VPLSGFRSRAALHSHLALANKFLACARYFRNVIFFDYLIINNPALFRAKEKGKGKQKKISAGI
jgi:hypothetical protein